MAEVVFAGAIMAIALRSIYRYMRDPNGIARQSSRGAYMRELSEKMKAECPRK